MRKAEVFVVVLLLMLPTWIPARGEGVPITIAPLNDNIPAVPGEAITIPFEIRNVGNSTISNVTVYVTGPQEGFLYQSKLIRTPIPPNGTLQDTITVKVLTVPPGTYNLTLVARAGRFYAQANVRVKVGVLSDYTLEVDVQKRYLYGHNVSITLKVVSKANGIMLGSIGYSITINGRPLESNETTTYLSPGEAWTKVIRLQKPQIGNYAVRLWANLGGKHKEIVKSFVVYQRHLNYRVYFENGAIHVLVYNSSGGVPGIRVRINGVEFETDESGTVSYAVDSPGAYEIVLDLDGKTVTTFVEVKRLFITYRQENQTLLVKVVDSNGLPVPNVTVVASGPLGEEYTVTGPGGIAEVDLRKVGYGSVLLSAESDKYIGTHTVATVNPPTPSSRASTNGSTTPSLPSSTYSNGTLPTGPSKPRGNALPLILIVSGLILAGTSYVAFTKPTVHEETLDRHYFVKVKAPRLKPLRGFRFEKPITAVDVRATKGEVRLEDGRLVWELDLEPGEEAYLQALLG